MADSFETITAAVPDPADVRARLARGRGLRISLGEAATTPAAEAATRVLRQALGADFTVFCTPGGGGAVLTVMQLVSEPEAAALRPLLDALVAEFRHTAAGLVHQMQLADDDEPEAVHYDGAAWYLYEHGVHCRFENETNGQVVEANMYVPDAVDPYFLLEYAETSGRHGAVLDACVHGFSDMCRLLDLAGITYR